MEPTDVSNKAPAHLNFRAFVNTLKSDGDLVEINDEVDWNLEAGAIIRKVHETDAPAVLLNNLKGQDEDGLWRIIGAPTSLRRNPGEKFGRIARHLDLPVTCTMKDIMTKMLQAAHQRLVPPRIVSSGPCKDYVKRSGSFDFTELPAPHLHQLDGGRYVLTLGMHIVQSPDGKWTNWSIARAMVLGPNRLVGLIPPTQHLGKILQMWKDEGKDMPWALALGAPPAAIMVSSMAIPDDVNEADYVGAMVGQPVDVVKCETNDLLVPANSEIVFEGRVSVTETAEEGPFGEMHGYTFVGNSSQQPVYTVDMLTHRSNPILPVCNPGRITDETHTMLGVLAAAEGLRLCQEANLPVLEAFCPFESQVSWLVLQFDINQLPSLNKGSKDLRKMVADLLFSAKEVFIVHKILLVGNDIDIYNWADVSFAYTTRCRPGVDELFSDEWEQKTGEVCPAFPLLPYMSHPKSGEKMRGGKCVSDCLMPSEYLGKRDWETADFRHCVPQSMQDEINAKWEKWGFATSRA